MKRGRNRQETEERLKDAVERLLVRGGFSAVTPSEVGREAGADKMLIYRYFGDLEGLMRAVIARPGFFPTFDGLCGGDLKEMLQQPAPKRARAILQRYLDALGVSPVALELMAWELVERNALTEVTEAAREALGLRIVRDLLPELDSRTGAAVTALLGSSLTYLVLRRRKISTFDGLDLRSGETWTLLLNTLEVMVDGVLQQSTTGLHSKLATL